MREYMKLTISLITGMSMRVVEATTNGQFKEQQQSSILLVKGLIVRRRGIVDIITTIHNEFEKADHTVVMLIDSPGGSIERCQIIYNELIYCKARYNKRLVVYIPSQALSYSMYLSAAADEVIVNPHALVGSIGVTRKSFFGGAGGSDVYYGSKSAGNLYLDRESPEFINAKLAELEAEFYDVMIKGRKMTKEDLVYLQGRALYAGTEEASVFNIDKLMTLEEFLAYAMDKGYTKSEKVRLVELLGSNTESQDWIKTKNKTKFLSSIKKY
jgi:ClpP class serine protease